MALHRLSFVLFISTVVLVACGGGGGGGATGSSGGTVPSTAQGDAHFTISDPYGGQSAARRPNYFSTATHYISITTSSKSATLDLSASSPQCTVSSGTISCAVDLAEPNGPLTFTVQTLDANQVALSQVTGTATINGTTTIPLALQGIWKSAGVHLGNETPQIGAPSTIPVTVDAYDADGVLIIGPEPYTSPISLYNSDTSGATSLSATSVTKPGQAIALSYDGHSYVNAVISAGGPHGQSLGLEGVLVPALPISEYPMPSGTVAANHAGVGHLISNADGTLTFVEQGPIGQVTTSGQVTELPMSAFYFDLVRAADKSLWAITHSCTSNCTSQDNNTLSMVNADGSISSLPMFTYYAQGPATLGPDGNFWMRADPGVPQLPVVQRVTPSGAVTDFALPSGLTGISSANTVGNDGNLWFVGGTTQSVSFVRVTTSGATTAFPIFTNNCCEGLMSDIISGPDGALYAVFDDTDLGRMTTSGTFSQIPISFLAPTAFGGQQIRNAIAQGPDGAIWIAMGLEHGCLPEIERVTPSGGYTVLALPVTCDPVTGTAPEIDGLASGPDGNLWYTRGTSVGKIVLK